MLESDQEERGHPGQREVYPVVDIGAVVDEKTISKGCQPQGRGRKCPP